MLDDPLIALILSDGNGNHYCIGFKAQTSNEFDIRATSGTQNITINNKLVNIKAKTLIQNGKEVKK
jgi:hypothetical protein